MSYTHQNPELPYTFHNYLSTQMQYRATIQSKIEPFSCKVPIMKQILLPISCIVTHEIYYQIR